ncbi:glycerophosphodiester phosphodiesterase family protein [Hansschlegelia plantiphila]|uniref:Phosphodiesterase n=1 Tax=Hansschlegelia plantiphila TaxID=374655 RepID=A0A9W6J535_9HYPH|nr:glycerophosphodiester phosphodiesterase family protein [Hansschlegelia plantiphila]GLK69554.1 phosphodiesterase [Hansschlegelia plantiphila]
MGRLDWLTARPIAHRGLHDRAAGVVENTPAAVSRALDGGYAVEIDVRETADGEAVVFHDATLDRLTADTGPIRARTLAELRRIPLRDTTERIWTLDECLDLVGDRGALVIEIKSPWNRDVGHARRVVERVAARDRPIAIKSFNPRAVRAAFEVAPQVPRGVIGEAFADDDPAWSHLGKRRRESARGLKHIRLTRPDFLSWDIADIERPRVAELRAAGKPVVVWTVKTPADETRARDYADQIVFEGFRPKAT